MGFEPVTDVGYGVDFPFHYDESKNLPALLGVDSEDLDEAENAANEKLREAGFELVQAVEYGNFWGGDLAFALVVAETYARMTPATLKNMVNGKHSNVSEAAEAQLTDCLAHFGLKGKPSWLTMESVL